jgi:hypothetical protein
VVKKVVPSTIVGSSSYHRRALQDLLAIKAKYGMPSFFLTLTSDEVSELRWEEINDLEEFLKRFGRGDKTWKDAPVECARLFHDRVTAFMKEFILPGSKYNVLGKLSITLQGMNVSFVVACMHTYCCGLMKRMWSVCLKRLLHRYHTSLWKTLSFRSYWLSMEPRKVVLNGIC